MVICHDSPISKKTGDNNSQTHSVENEIIIFNIYIAHVSYGYDQMRITNKYSFQQLRVSDSLQQQLTYINNRNCPQY